MESFVITLISHRIQPFSQGQPSAISKNTTVMQFILIGRLFVL